MSQCRGQYPEMTFPSPLPPHVPAVGRRVSVKEGELTLVTVGFSAVHKHMKSDGHIALPLYPSDQHR